MGTSERTSQAKERHERMKYVGYYRKYLLLLPKDIATDLRSPISAPFLNKQPGAYSRKYGKDIQI